MRHDIKSYARIISCRKITFWLPLFRNKRFILNLIPQQNASRFAVFYEYKKIKVAFSISHIMQFFPLMKVYKCYQKRCKALFHNGISKKLEGKPKSEFSVQPQISVINRTYH